MATPLVLTPAWNGSSAGFDIGRDPDLDGHDTQIRRRGFAQLAPSVFSGASVSISRRPSCAVSIEQDYWSPEGACPAVLEGGRRNGGVCWRATPKNTRLDSSRTRQACARKKHIGPIDPDACTLDQFLNSLEIRATADVLVDGVEVWIGSRCFALRRPLHRPALPATANSAASARN